MATNNILTVLPGLKFFNLTNPMLKLVKTVDLPAYSDEFYHTNADNAEFIVPTNGTYHTTNTIYSRCEYRETLENSETLSNWDAAAQPENWMEFVIQVNDPGHDEKLIIGQIHGKSTHPIYKTQWKQGKIYAQFREYLNGSDVDVYLADAPLGSKTKIKISLDNTFLLTITVNDAVKYQVQANRQSYKDDRFYFKVGAYVQTEIDTAVSTANVKLYALDVHHGVPVVVAAPVRTLADMTADVNKAVQDFQVALITLAQAEAIITGVKVEADAQPAGAERTALYQLIVQSRTTIRTPAVEKTPEGYTLADLGAQVDAAVATWNQGGYTLQQAEDYLTGIKTEADTYFKASDDRTALYTKITAAREVIRHVPTEGELIEKELTAIQADYQSAAVTLIDAKNRLNAASTRIKALTDASERLALNNHAAQVKAILV
jgi:cytidine deaminase